MKNLEKNILKIWTEKNNFSVFPDRWAIVFSIVLWWKEILFQEMLEETLFDFEKNVRWGIPIMFPNSWPLNQDDIKKLGYDLPQHWILRINSWDIFEVWENFIILKFDEKNQKWDFKILQKFEIFIKYEIFENIFKISMKIKNNDEKNLIFSHWFHPYFKNFWKDKIIWDKKFSEKILKDSKIWQNDGTLSFFLPEEGISFEISEIWKINIKCSFDFKKFWLWSMENKNFVCVEPVVWDEGNISKNPIILKKWEILDSFFEIKLEKIWFK